MDGMQEDEQGRLERLFYAALEIPPEERGAFLDEVCGDDIDLRNRLESLLREHNGEYVVESPSNERDSAPAAKDVEPMISSVGPYRVIEKIGEGGMGEVYRAERSGSMQQTVAVKIVKLGMNSRAVIKRFESERQTLATMSHPNIARVIDAGTTENGRPYFVMEYVENGKPFVEFCNTNRLSVRDRLDLFVTICDAIGHAHTKLTVHRDIKDSNVLAHFQDGNPAVKVIDFGVAKALSEDRMLSESLQTVQGGRIGTLACMSPEQAYGRLDLDTRTDIYSMGVLLYELLSGAKPFDPAMLDRAPLNEQLDIIGTREPIRMSQQVSMLPRDEAERVARDRSTNSKRLIKSLSSDLQRIPHRAMQKEPGERYKTLQEFSEDIKAFLRGDTVKAYRPSLGYRIRKTFQRRRVPILFGLALMLTVCTAIVAYILQVQRSNQQLEEELYFQRIAEVQQELAIRDSPQAIKLLEDCPVHLRGWEWDYLMRRVEGEPLTLRGHTAALWMANFSPDARSVVTAGMDGEVKIWDSETGTMTSSINAEPTPILPSRFSWFPIDAVRRLTQSNRIPITAAVYSPDGRYLASGSFAPKLGGLDPETNMPTIDAENSPGVVTLWDADSGRKIDDYTGHRGIVVSVAYSPDGRFLASSTIGPDYTFSVWDAATRKTVKIVAGHQSVIHRLRFSPDGKYLASGDTAGTLKLWDTQTYSQVRSHDAHRGPIIDIAFSHNGRYLATSSQDAQLSMWETESLQKVRDFAGHQGAALGVAFSPDDRLLASSGYDRTVRLWDVDSGRQRIALRGHEETVWSIAFDRTGKRLLSSSFDSTAIIWDSTPRKVSNPSEVFTVAPNADRVNAIAFSPDRRFLASSGWDQSVCLSDARDGTLIRKLQGHKGSTWGLAFSPDSQRIASASWDRTIKVWSLNSSEQPLTLLGHTQPVHSVCFNHDGTRILSGGWDGKVTLWDSKTGQIIRSHDGNLLPTMTVAFSPDGKCYAGGGGDRMVRVWDNTTGKLLRTYVADSSVVYAIAFSPDSRYLAAGGWGRGFKLWDLTDAKSTAPLLEKTGHQDRVTGIVFSPDGSHLATASEDNTVRIWDAKSGAEKGEPLLHRGMVWSIALSPDGKRLATGSWYKPGSVRTWTSPFPQAPGGQSK